MGTIRKLLIATVILGSLAGVAGSGTFASFNATTTNAATAFDTGSLAIGQGTGGTTCWSTGATAALPDASFTNGNTAACGALFTTQTDVKPGMTDLVANLQMNAAGTINAGSFKVYMSTSCTTANDTGTIHGDTTVAGTATDICTYLRMTIVEYTSNTYATPIASGSCVYGNNSCVIANNTQTVYNFQTSYGSPATGLSLGTLTSATARFFKVTFSFPSSATVGAENNIMGKKLNSLFALGWTLEQ